MKYHVVTTMNAAGWEEAGRRMATSFVKNWPDKALPLTIYAEGFTPDISEGIALRTLPSWLQDFKSAHGNTVAYNGKINGGYDFRYDAVKFSHKVAALTDFGLSLNEGMMIWIDADTFTHSEISAEWLAGLFRGNGYIAWLDRMNTYVESGFVMFRCEHRSHREFMRRYALIYQSGSLFRMRETHDSFVLASLVADFQREGRIERPVSLSGDTRWHHPFVNGPLGAKIDHMKGPRKIRGRSEPRDFKSPRKEQYWVQS